MGLAACAGPRTNATKAPAAAPAAQPAPVAPAAAPGASPRPGTAENPEGVYRNPKIGVVYLRAHVDAAGRLLGPQVMYQVVDPGGWNMEAVEEGGGADAHQPADNARGLPHHPEGRPSKLLDPRLAATIEITGLMRPEDRLEAQTLAAKRGGGVTAEFDSEAGWLLVPPPPN